jgi:probable phosphoglycerate mutase
MNANPSSPHPTTLILVRHGETEGNVAQVWHGALDAPLTPRGEAQVAAVAQRIAAMHHAHPIELFYVSPLARARSTAAAISRATGLQPQVDEGLREFDLGDWEGRTFRDLKETENLWQRWDADPSFAPPNGESPRAFNRRAIDALQTLTTRHLGQTVLVVTHGGVIGTVLASWFGAGPDDWRSFDPHNCAVSVLEWDEGGWRGQVLNDITHLPPEAVVNFKAAYET